MKLRAFLRKQFLYQMQVLLLVLQLNMYLYYPPEYFINIDRRNII